MASKKEPRFEQKEYIAGGEDGGWSENDVTYDGKKVMENVPEGYASELQRELGRSKAMKEVNYPKPEGKKKGGMIRSSASKRADGIAQRGKTRGKMV